MVYLLRDGNLLPDDPAAAGPRLCIAPPTKLAEAKTLLGKNAPLLERLLESGVARHESRDQFDYISFALPDLGNLLAPAEQFSVCLTHDLLIFITDGSPEVDAVFETIRSEEYRATGLGQVLYLFLDRLTSNDYLTLEAIEQEISELEEALITDEKSSCIREIVSLRRRLMALKRYYEQLFTICEGIEQNENGLCEKGMLRYFRLLSQRINRLENHVLNLRDYVTQVREAYQAQVDINLNQIMKVFTVITAIFLPLTLIAGWYGMNLAMPEYHWPYAYPVVICVSAAVVGLFILFFKKKHWF